MVGLLLLLLIIVPIVEIYVIVQVAGSIGVVETALALVAISVAGVWLAKLAGLGVLNRLQATVRQGRVPSAELVDGGLVLLAGALMVLPGFVSDAVAILLLLPPTRSLVRGAVLGRIRAGGGRVATVLDVDYREEPPTSPRRGQLGR